MHSVDRTGEMCERGRGVMLTLLQNRLALSALTGNDPKKVLTSRASTISHTQNFNVKINLEGSPITNQRASGRCWLFAATNVFRVPIMKRYNLKDFELSQAYLFYWDKVEKSNYFLEQILDTLDEPLDGRLLQQLLAGPVGDGGQWDMVANLVEKYGIVPQQFYPDAFSASSSSTMDALITTKLREYAIRLRHLAQTSRSSIPTAKEEMMREVTMILTLMLGPPPSPKKSLTWEFYDRNDKFHSVEIEPLKFAQDLSTDAMVESISGVDVHRLFSLVNDPRNEYGTHLSISRLGNVSDGRPVSYVNVDMDTMKAACIAMLKADVPIFFGSDVGKFSNRQSGIMDTGILDYEVAFNTKLGMSKAQRLMTKESEMTHAMVLTAVHLDDEGKPVRWRVQNSWGEDVGSKGWFVMSDRWMDQFVYQAVVAPQYVILLHEHSYTTLTFIRFVPKEISDVLKKEPKV